MFNIVATIFTLLEQLAVLEVLGGRIDAVENEVQAIGNDLSRVLGKLLGLQNRIGVNESQIVEVRGIALDAKDIGEAASLKAGAAQVTATRAENFGKTAITNAKQAQLTADGAVRNAAIANENAGTAYKQGVKAQGIGEQAAKLGGQALEKAGQALAVLTTVIATVQLVKGHLANTVISGLEILGGTMGKVGNALKKWGVVGEKAYEFFGVAESKYESCDRLKLAGAMRPQRIITVLKIMYY